VEYEYDEDRDAVIEQVTTRTSRGVLTRRATCYRADPPSPTEKPIKDLARDLPAYMEITPAPQDLDEEKLEEMRSECEKRGQAFGLTIGYPGFQQWYTAMDDGIAALSYAEMDTPDLLKEWHDHDLANGTRAMELLLSADLDYILFGGSGTITLASPDLARKYALPALKKWSRMAKEAGVPTMLHSCGKSRLLVDMLAEETDVDSINPLEPPPMGDVDLAEVKRARGEGISLMGNLHTTEVMLHGSAAEVRQAAIQAMRDAGPGGGFILSTGDQCGRETPDENLFTLVETAREFGVYDPETGRLPRLQE
jgi:uroporphyrinogen decarboxylase